MVKRTLTEEHKRKLSESRKKDLVCIERLKQLAIGQRGTVFTIERRRMMAAVRLGKKHTEETKGKISLFNKGKEFSETHRANLRKGWIKRRENGNTMSFDGKRRVSASSRQRIGWKHTEEAKVLMSEIRTRKLMNDELHTKFIYKNKKFRSNWEIIVAEWMDQKSIIYEYERHRFKRPSGRYFVPDFFIPSANTFIEVKGYYRQDDIEKIKEFKESGNNLIVIDKEKINILDNSLSALIASAIVENNGQKLY